MIVYRTPTRTVECRDVLKLAAFDSHENIRRFLIHWGEVESAHADELCPDFDESHPEIDRLREVSMLAGRLFVKQDARTAARLNALLARLELPERPVRVRIPEGYAYYGLFPETYAQAARRLFDAKWPAEAVCIGIRSIGTSLSAVAGAALEQCGSRVYSWTVRPHGHPFDRRLRIGPDLEDAWRALSHACFVIVDEGPGLSGSSFAAVAQYLSRLGIPDHRIVFMPSWIPAGDQFVCEPARAVWRRHDKYAVEPESGGCIDISAGKWRSIFYGHESEYPPVQPQHEARKYLCSSPNGTAFKKFAGLGLYGEMKLHAARTLSGAGFCPPVLGLEDGYLMTKFVPGQPLSASTTDPQLLETMARYLAFRARAFAASESTPLEELAHMLQFNSGLTIRPPDSTQGVVTDGRMLPHEWIATPTGYLKTDALDHGDNHFYPGPTDIAWDVAGAITEFNLDQQEREYLVSQYTRVSGDRNIRSRLPFFTAAYLAFRMGYARMNHFTKQAEYYRGLLEPEVSRAV